MTRKRLQTIGFFLMAFGMLALGLNFVARRIASRRAEALSIRLDAISRNVDAFRDAGNPRSDASSITTSIEDASGDLLGIRRSYDSPFSLLNLSFFAYAILIIAGSVMTTLAASRRGNPTAKDGG
ncbi:hypothetical protein SAMN06265222_1261 [Neorhodopirellula lusitana]|uniref:Uncharacterized protein n=1 Tax=Neorhodopirellula lusitana TaxID=445327 RepID=A0ABY1QRU0_9BACT|nr:hypothetical protein SAMN06265222_1261 [Neorhodopirellula lusitana]